MMLGVKVKRHDFDKSVPSGAHQLIEAAYPAGLYFPSTQSHVYEGMGYLGHLGFDGVMRWASSDIKFTLAQDMTDMAEAESLLNIAEEGFAELQGRMSQQMFDRICTLLDKANDEETPAVKRQLAHEVYNLLKSIENGDEPPPSGSAPDGSASDDEDNKAWERFVAENGPQSDDSDFVGAAIDLAQLLDAARVEAAKGGPEAAILNAALAQLNVAEFVEAEAEAAVEALDDAREAYLDGFLAADSPDYLKQAVTCEGTTQEVAHKVARALYASGAWNGLEQILVTDDPGSSEPREGRHYDFPQRQNRFILRYKLDNKWLGVCYAWSDEEAVLFDTVDEARKFAQSYVYDNDLEGDVEFECRRYNGEDRQRFTILSGDAPLMPADDTETLGKGKLTLKQRVAELTAERDELAAVLDEMEADVNDLLARKGRAYQADPLLADASIVQQLEAELDFGKSAPVEVRTLVQLMAWDPRQSVTTQTNKADDDLAAHLNDGWTIINMTINTVAGNDGTRHYRYVTLQRPAQPQPAPVAPTPIPDDGAKEAISPSGENGTLPNAQGVKSPLPDLLADKPIGRAIREHGLNAVTEAMNAHVIDAARRAYEADDDQPLPALPDQRAEQRAS